VRNDQGLLEEVLPSGPKNHIEAILVVKNSPQATPELHCKFEEVKMSWGGLGTRIEDGAIKGHRSRADWHFDHVNPRAGQNENNINFLGLLKALQVQETRNETDLKGVHCSLSVIICVYNY